MDEKKFLSKEKLKYLKLLAQKFPTQQSVCTEIINLTAILNLPKGTEHFMSDIHGEYAAFNHILNNCSGVIREKVEKTFKDQLGKEEIDDLCTLIYYPQERMELLESRGQLNDAFYRVNLRNLIEIAKVVSSKYTRSKVRKAMPKEFAYIIDELLHTLPDEDNNQLEYHNKIIETIIGIENGDEFVIALANLIKSLAVDHLHIVGDFYDRGDSADKILDLLMNYHELDIQWGNHDVLWMGAAAGSDACIANVIRVNIKLGNTRILESAYGVSLRNLTTFAETHYTGTPMEAAVKAINVITMKLEGMAIMRHPEYEMDDRLLFNRTDFKNGVVTIDGKEVKLNTTEFPTIDPENPYSLTEEEEEVMKDLRFSFKHSQKLNEHIEFLYAKGALYKIFNGNLLYHSCIPLNEDGSFYSLNVEGKSYSGRDLMDHCDILARKAYYAPDQESLDFMWYLWGGSHSPVMGRVVTTWERIFIDDRKYWEEKQDPYYDYIEDGGKCEEILEEFGLTLPISHIINGHTPVHTKKGESPIKGDGKLIVIDGGFCSLYHNKTGIAGYTLIYNSHGMRIASHQSFTSKEKVVEENADIQSTIDNFEQEPYRIMVANADNGKAIVEDIWDLRLLLKAYRYGIISENK